MILPISKEEIIISLIMDDIVHSKLIGALEKLDLDPSSYYTNMSESIVTLAGCKGKQKEICYHRYLELKAKLINSNIQNDKKRLRSVAMGIYKAILNTDK